MRDLRYGLDARDLGERLPYPRLAVAAGHARDVKGGLHLRLESLDWAERSRYFVGGGSKSARTLRK